MNWFETRKKNKLEYKRVELQAEIEALEEIIASLPSGPISLLDRLVHLKTRLALVNHKLANMS